MFGARFQISEWFERIDTGCSKARDHVLRRCCMRPRSECSWQYITALHSHLTRRACTTLRSSNTLALVPPEVLERTKHSDVCNLQEMSCVRRKQQNVDLVGCGVLQ